MSIDKALYEKHISNDIYACKSKIYGATRVYIYT